MIFETSFYRGLYPTSNTLLYTVPKDKISVLTAINITNRSSVQGGAFLYIVSNGSSASNENVLLYNYPVQPITLPSGYGNFLSLKLWEVIPEEDYSIYGYCTGDLTLSLNGSERPKTKI